MRFLKKLFFGSSKQKWTKVKNGCWQSAKKACTGYDKIETAVTKNEDFATKLISYPLIANLIRISANSNHLKVLDFGGSNGCSYRDTKNFYPTIKLEWDIVEQKSLVDAYKNSVESDINMMSEIPTNKKYDVVIISSVLQYLEDYRPHLEKLLNLGASYIIIDRTLVFASSKNKEPILTIQHNDSSFYGKKTSYPCFILNENKIFAQIEEKYKLENRFFSAIDQLNKIAGVRVASVGGVFKKAT